jgi:signal transduction histidine kinase
MYRDTFLAKPGRPLHLAALAIVAFALAAASLAWSGYQGQVDRIVLESELRARGAAADVERYVHSRWRTLYAVAAAPPIRSGNLESMRAYFTSLDTDLLGFDAGVSWIDRDGWMQVRTGDYTGPPIDFSEREHIRDALGNGRPSVSSVILGTVNQAPIVAFAVPVLEDDGSVAGLIASGIRLDNMHISADNLRYAGGTNVIVLDRLGQFVVGAGPVHELTTADSAFEQSAMRQSGSGALRSGLGPGGQPDQLIGYSIAPTAGWLVLVSSSSAGSFEAATQALSNRFIAIGVGAGLAVILLLWAARRLGAAVQAERSSLVKLQDAVSVLERRHALRDSFIGVMSHELRTPLTTIYGAAKLLARSPRRDELESLVSDIEEEADRLHRITEDLLVLSRFEHGLIEITSEPVLLQRLVPAIHSDIERRLPGAPIVLDFPDDLPAISGDSGALSQVLNNLLANATKYAAGAPISLSARNVGDVVTVTVADQGPGLADTERERVFDLFYRSPGTAKRASGTGIGLFIVRQLVEAMGGEVHAEQNEPHGVRFVVRLAVYRAWRSELAQADQDPDPPMRALAHTGP